MDPRYAVLHHSVLSSIIPSTFPSLAYLALFAIWTSFTYLRICRPLAVTTLGILLLTCPLLPSAWIPRILAICATLRVLLSLCTKLHHHCKHLHENCPSSPSSISSRPGFRPLVTWILLFLVLPLCQLALVQHLDHIFAIRHCQDFLRFDAGNNSTPITITNLAAPRMNIVGNEALKRFKPLSRDLNVTFCNINLARAALTTSVAASKKKRPHQHHHQQRRLLPLGEAMLEECAVPTSAASQDNENLRRIRSLESLSNNVIDAQRLVMDIRAVGIRMGEENVRLFRALTSLPPAPGFWDWDHIVYSSSLDKRATWPSLSPLSSSWWQHSLARHLLLTQGPLKGQRRLYEGIVNHFFRDARFTQAREAMADFFSSWDSFVDKTYKLHDRRCSNTTTTSPTTIAPDHYTDTDLLTGLQDYHDTYLLEGLHHPDGPAPDHVPIAHALQEMLDGPGGTCARSRRVMAEALRDEEEAWRAEQMKKWRVCGILEGSEVERRKAEWRHGWALMGIGERVE